jgi:hypothetical protein
MALLDLLWLKQKDSAGHVGRISMAFVYRGRLCVRQHYLEGNSVSTDFESVEAWLVHVLGMLDHDEVLTGFGQVGRPLSIRKILRINLLITLFISGGSLCRGATAKVKILTVLPPRFGLITVAHG